jgi:6,7-dimethyl-8-ribityllumazine synthase
VTNDIDQTSDNVLSESLASGGAENEPEAAASTPAASSAAEELAAGELAVEEEGPAWGSTPSPDSGEGAGALELVEFEEQEEGGEPEPVAEDGPSQVAVAPGQHAEGELEVPDGYAVLEGSVDGARRSVGVVVARFNGDVTSRLLEGALEELAAAGVRQDAITVLVVPGAFELPLAATALAKTRRYACIVALGCVIRGDTPHFDYVASEAASGIQLAALETGVPVSFGVLTLDRADQADARIEKGTEAVRTALEMADVFSHLRAAAAR